METDLEMLERTSTPIVCLLPARNAADDLPDWFTSVAEVADAVVALDDGSTDDTGDLLRAHPLVARVLTNAPRAGFAGWDDAANRNRLLEAAAELSPRWIVQLDADERLPADDAQALRGFLLEQADPTCGYCLQIYRMVEDLEHYDPAAVILGRVFAHRPGQRLPEQRLHPVALPVSIPPSRWVRTTFRVQHLASLTAEHRRDRYAKYQEVDPECRYQSTYEHLLADPLVVRRWMPRSAHLAPVLNQPQPVSEPASDEPVFSAVVIAQDDEATIAESIEAILAQDCDGPVEVIVVTSGRDRTAAIVREQFPQVRQIEFAAPVLPGVARNAGLRAARGRYVGFPGSHVVLQPGNLAAALRAHREGYTMVMGSVINGTTTRAGRANYFLDHSSTLPGRPGGPLQHAPVRASYVREPREEVGCFPEHLRAGEDVQANLALWQRGYSAVRVPEVRIRHDARSRTPGQLLQHHFARGRAFGVVLADEARLARRFPTRRMVNSTLGLGPIRVHAVVTEVYRYGPEFRRELWPSLPLIMAAQWSAWSGMLYELVRLAPRLARSTRTARRPH